LQIAFGALDSKFKALKQNSNSLEVSVVIQELEKMSQEATKAGFNMSAFDAAIQGLKDGQDVKDILRGLGTSVEDLGADAYNAGDKIKTLLTAGGMDGTLVDSYLDKLYDSWVKQGIITAEVAEKLKNVARQAEDAGNKMANMKMPPPSLGSTFVTLAQSISNVSMAINTLRGVWDTWTNDDMSFGEKLLSTFTSLGMVIPMLVTGVKNLT
jgi:hypothetical protein